MEDKTDATR
uniref:Uncharacterized protein n=1 Tax=Arundo donax TaxID=35708 RepID=A0A0A9CB40_ARUDO